MVRSILMFLMDVMRTGSTPIGGRVRNQRCKACALILVLAVIVSVGTLPAQDAQTTQDETSLSDEMLLAAEDVTGSVGESNLLFNQGITHYDENGYPEDKAGRLALSPDPEGPMVFTQNDPVPYLLYAQYVNRQRDAVFLARTGTISDVLPSGDEYEVPYGFGAVKFNTIYVSILESLLVPHFSDNQKTYELFPIRDLYVGGGFGLTGITVIVRYVHREQFVGEAQIGWNPFAGINPASILNQYALPVHLGGGYRFPGLFPEMLGENMWTAGIDFFGGFGDRDDDPATGPFVLPGVFLDVERVLYDEAGRRRDYRTDPRPYNYNVNALSLRIAAYLNVRAIGTGASVVVPGLTLSYQYNIIGPEIPEHQFKETNVLYVNEVYREDLERQAARRAAREDRQ